MKITNDITATFVLGFVIFLASFIMAHFYFRKRYKVKRAKMCGIGVSQLEALEGRIRPIIFELVEEEKARLHAIYLQQGYYDSKLKECKGSTKDFDIDSLIYEHLKLDIEISELRYKSKLQTLRSIDERIITLKKENDEN
jgi:hypothetical protein